MSDDSYNEPGASEPKLRAFLKQAAAVIATTRGLNEESQARLRSLADRVGLSTEQYEKALNQLKQSDHASFRLNHWERDFVAQLKNRFQNLSQNILKPKTEQKIIRAATEKYQIAPTRAQQLIDHYVEQMGIGRVQQEDAQELLLSSIGTIVENRLSISETEHQKLIDFGSTWGINSETTQELLDAHLRRNRVAAKRLKTRRLLGWASGLGLMLMIAATVFFWQQGWFEAKPREEKVNVKSELATHSPPTETLPRWWNQRLIQSTEVLIDDGFLNRDEISDLQNEDGRIRAEAFRSLLQKFMTQSEVQNQGAALRLLAFLWEADPEITEIDRQLDDAHRELFSIQSPKFPVASQRVRVAWDTNARLAAIFQANHESLAEQKLVDAIRDASLRYWKFDADIPTAQLVNQTRYKILQNFWAHLANTAWASTSRASLLLEALVELSDNELEVQEFSNRLNQVLFAILEKSPDRFRDLQGPIRTAVSIADPNRIQLWIRFCLDATDRSLQDWMANQLADHLKLRRSPSLLSELRQMQLAYRRKKYARTIETSSAVMGLANEVLDSINLSGSLNRPDQIAKLAYVNNLLIEFEKTPLTRSGLDSILSRCRSGLPDLRNRIGLKKLGVSEPVLGSEPTEFERRQFQEQIKRLSGNDTLSVKRRALDTLAEIAKRFPRIRYRDAEVLASHIFQEHDLETTLNIEKNLTAFKDWPNLGLAMADQLNEINRPLDTTLTILTLQQGQVFDIRNPKQWKEDLRRQLRNASISKLRKKLEAEPSPQDLDWKRLQLWFPESMRERSQRIGTSGLSKDSVSLESTFKKMEQGLLKDSATLPQQPTLNIVFQSFPTHMESVIMSLQRLTRLWANAPGMEPIANELAQYESEYLRLASGKTAGQRLLLVERWLLQVLKLRHRTLVAQRVGDNDE